MAEFRKNTDFSPGLVRQGLGRSIIGRFAFRRADKLLIFSTVTLSIFGLLMVYSATFSEFDSTYYFKRQLVFLIVGLAVMVLAASFDYRKLISYAWHIYAAAMFLLCIVLLFPPRRGARRWITLGFMDFQPSELAKLAVIILIAAFIADRRMVIETNREFLVALGLICFPAFLVFLEPDLGMSIMILTIGLGLLAIGGARLRRILAVVVGFVAFFALSVQLNILKAYQLSRLLVFVRPDIDPLNIGYNLAQSKIAIGSGQILGKGLFRGTQTNLRFIPSHHTDFIFSVIGEELGFLGASLVLLLFGLLLWRAFKTASNARDLFGTMVATGITIMFLVQVFVNVGMTIGIMPTTGITLPFLSYGGNSLILCFFSVGLLLNIGTHRFSQV